MTNVAWPSRVVFSVFIGTLSCTYAHASGFDDSYLTYQGDVNSDGNQDVYVKSSSSSIVFVGGIPVITGPPVKAFLLSNNGNGSFDLVTTLTAAQQTAVKQWPESEVTIGIRDADVSGDDDLELVGIFREIPNAREQIILSDSTWGAPPIQIVDKDLKFRSFHSDLISSLIDPDYFENNAPPRITSSWPGNNIYFGSVAQAGNFGSAGNLMTACEIAVEFQPTKMCALSNHNPSPCVRTVNVYNEYDQYIGTETRNVCDLFVHVFIFVANQIVVEKDYSVFDQDAMETKVVLDRLNADCSLFMTSSDTAFIDNIINVIWGFSLASIVNSPNSYPHPKAPGDTIFDRSDPTFHHYDAITKFCDLGQAGCSLSDANSPSYFGIRWFNHPSLFLGARLTALDGSNVPVFLAFPWDVTEPSKYFIPFGIVTQQLLSSTYWENGIQNITTPAHWVYPGTITRHIRKKGNALWTETHGIGVNKFWCVPETTLDLDPVVGVRIIMAMANDHFGPTTFSTLDAQMKSAWDGQHGTTSPPPTAFGQAHKFMQVNP